MASREAFAWSGIWVRVRARVRARIRVRGREAFAWSGIWVRVRARFRVRVRVRVGGQGGLCVERHLPIRVRGIEVLVVLMDPGGELR